MGDTTSKWYRNFFIMKVHPANRPFGIAIGRDDHKFAIIIALWFYNIGWSYEQ